MTKKLYSMEQLEYCKRCQNRTVSREQGILCGLTNQKPNFIDECPDYKEDPVQAKRLERHKKKFNQKEVHKESIVRAYATGAPIVTIGYLLVKVLPVPFFVKILGLIMLGLGAIFLLYGTIKLLVLNQKSDEEIKPVDKSNPNKDMEVY